MSSIAGEALSNTSEGKPKDFLWLHLRELPYFRALLRAVEARFYQDLDLPAPILDVGCGDGHFASVTFEKPLDVGIDPWRVMLPSARAYGGYRWVIQGLGNELPFADNRFASVISNSVLEHIPQVDDVVKEIHRVLRPGGRFVFCVPNHRFPQELSISKFFQRLGLEPLASAYSRFFNRISRHHHCDDVPVWQRRLEMAGFTLERYWHYFPPAALHTLEWGHYLGLPSLVSRWITGRWILAPTRWNLALTRRLVQRFYDENPVCENGVYSFYVARKVG